MMNPTMVSDSVHDQAYQEVMRWRHLLPVLEEEKRRIEAMISESPELADKLGPDKLHIEELMMLLSLSEGTIAGLDEERCHRLMGSIKELVKHQQESSLSMNLSKTLVLDDLHDQTYKEVLRSRDLLLILEEADIQMEGVMSESRDLADKYGNYKLLIERSIKLLSTSRDAIGRLNEEGCRQLLWLIKKVVPYLRKKFPAPRDNAQPWPAKIYLQPKEVINSTSPSKEVLSNNWYDHLCIEVKCMNYKYSKVLIVELARLELMMSKDKLSADTFEPHKFFLEKALNLMTLQRAEIARADKKECCRLVKMIKLFLMCKLIQGYANGVAERVWPPRYIFAISELLRQMNMKHRSDPVKPASNYSKMLWQDGRSSEGDWHEQAYKELLSMRTLYSFRLDMAYNSVYRDRLCDMLSRACDKFLKKSLEFLNFSRAEMVSLSQEKCYSRIFLIKFFVVLTAGTLSTNQNYHQPRASGSLPLTPEIPSESHQAYHCETASSNSTRDIQSARWKNWRDVAYEEMQGLRRKYSSQLDKIYRAVRGVCKQDPQQAIKGANSRSFLKESLNFLAITRTGLARETVEDCDDTLMRIRLLFNCPKKFISKEEFAEFVKSLFDSTHQSPPYWRDEVYAEMKSKEYKLQYEVNVALKKVHSLTHQIPELAKEFGEAKVCYDRAWAFMTMLRSKIALLSKEEYNEKVLLVNEDLARVEEILTSLQVRLGRRIGFRCDISQVLLKQWNNNA